MQNREAEPITGEAVFGKVKFLLNKFGVKSQEDLVLSGTIGNYSLEILQKSEDENKIYFSENTCFSPRRRIFTPNGILPIPSMYDTPGTITDDPSQILATEGETWSRFMDEIRSLLENPPANKDRIDELPLW